MTVVVVGDGVSFVGCTASIVDVDAMAVAGATAVAPAVAYVDRIVDFVDVVSECDYCKPYVKDCKFVAAFEQQPEEPTRIEDQKALGAAVILFVDA